MSNQAQSSDGVRWGFVPLRINLIAVHNLHCFRFIRTTEVRMGHYKGARQHQSFASKGRCPTKPSLRMGYGGAMYMEWHSN